MLAKRSKKGKLRAQFVEENRAAAGPQAGYIEGCGRTLGAKKKSMEQVRWVTRFRGTSAQWGKWPQPARESGSVRDRNRAASGGLGEEGGAQLALRRTENWPTYSLDAGHIAGEFQKIPGCFVFWWNGFRGSVPERGRREGRQR